jgi:hypothetical protein
MYISTYTFTSPSPSSSCRVPHGLLLVQLIGPLLKLFFAGRLAKVVGDDRTGVGLVVFESGGIAARGLVVGVVEGVTRGGRVLGLLCDLVVDA